MLPATEWTGKGDPVRQSGHSQVSSYSESRSYEAKTMYAEVLQKTRRIVIGQLSLAAIITWYAGVLREADCMFPY